MQFLVLLVVAFIAIATAFQSAGIYYHDTILLLIMMIIHVDIDHVNYYLLSIIHI